MDDGTKSETHDLENKNMETVQFRDPEEINTFLDSDEVLVTEEETREIDAIIEKREQELIVNQDTFDLWYDKITRRRMFALARLRKLTKVHKKRIELYEAVKNELEKKKITKSDESKSYESNTNSNENGPSLGGTPISVSIPSATFAASDPSPIVDNTSRLSSTDTVFNTGTAKSQNQGNKNVSRADTNDMSMTKTEWNDVDNRMASASDTTTEFESGYGEFESEGTEYPNDRIHVHSKKEVTPFIDEMIHTE